MLSVSCYIGLLFCPQSDRLGWCSMQSLSSGRFYTFFASLFPFCIVLLFSEISKKLDRRKKNAPFLYDALGEFALSL